MDNNDIFRRIRYTFDFDDFKMMELFELAEHQVKRAEVSDWLKKEDEPTFRELNDLDLAIFLNGLIIEKRGKREGPLPIPEKELNNNIVLMKLKIALNLKTNEIQEMFNLINKKISAHELSAFLRNPKKSQYRPCNDQYLRNFLSAMQVKYHNK